MKHVFPGQALRAVSLVLIVPVAAAFAEEGDTAGSADVGAGVYARACVACHQPGAVGAPGLAPPLAGKLAGHAGSDAGREYLVRVALTGMVGTINVDGVRYVGNSMPGFAALSDGEIAAVLAYVLRSFNGHSDLTWLTAQFVASVRDKGGTPNATHKLRGQLSTTGE